MSTETDHKQQRRRIVVDDLKTSQECDEAASWIVAELSRIKTSIANARRTAAVEGVFADHQWMTKAESAQRVLGRLHQEVARRRSMLAKAERTETHRRQVRDELGIVYDILRERFGEEWRIELMQEVRRRMNGA